MSITTTAAFRGSISSNGCALPVRAVMRLRAASEIAILCIVVSSTSRLTAICCGLASAQLGTKDGQDRAQERAYGCDLGILDRSRRYLYRRDRQAAGRRARHPQAAFGKSGSLPGRGGAWHPPSARAQVRRTNPERANRRRQ